MEAWLIENTVVTLALIGFVSIAGFGLQNRPAIRHALWLVLLLKLVTRGQGSKIFQAEFPF